MMDFEFFKSQAARLPEGERELASLMISVCEAAGDCFIPVCLDWGLSFRVCFGCAIVKPVDVDGMKSMALVFECDPRVKGWDVPYVTLLLSKKREPYKTRNEVLDILGDRRTVTYRKRVKLPDERVLYDSETAPTASAGFRHFAKSLYEKYVAIMQERFRDESEAKRRETEEAVKDARERIFGVIKELASKIL